MNSEIQEIVYTPESPLKDPVKMIKSMWHDLKVSRELAWRLTVRDISAQYRQSILGVVWAFLPPVVTTAMFVFLNQSKLMNVDSGAVPYPAYVLVGMVFWQLFAEALQAPLKIVTAAKGLLVKINFPREALMLSAVLQTLFSFGIKFLLIVAIFFWYKLAVPWTVVLLPLAILALLIFGFVLGVLLVPAGALFNDITQSLTLITTFWLFITPVGYPPGESGIMALLAKYNPVAPLVSTARDWMMSGSFTYIQEFLVITAVSVVVTFIGWVVYRVSLPIIIERMSA